MNDEYNLLHHVGVVAKRMRAAAAAETAAAHEGDDGDDNTPSGPAGRGVKTYPETYSILEGDSEGTDIAVCQSNPAKKEGAIF